MVLVVVYLALFLNKELPAMNTTIFERNGGYVSVVVCKNGKTFIVSTKLYATRKGAESANKRLDEFCGPGYSLNNIPYTVTKDDGSVETLYRTENRKGCN